MSQISRRFDPIEVTLTEHDRLFSMIRKKQAEHDEKFNEILGRFDPINRQFDRLENLSHTILLIISRIEARLEKGQGKRGGES